MTELKDRFAALLSAEPAARDDLDWIIARGRRAWRRRRAATTVAGTAGAAALSAAVIVPISLAHGAGDGSSAVSVATGGHTPAPVPTPTAAQHCVLIRTTTPRHGLPDAKHLRINAKELRAAAKRLGHDGRGEVFKIEDIHHGTDIELSYCATGRTAPSGTSPSSSPTPTTPPYTYTENPQMISNRLGVELTTAVQAHGLTITYTRPFSQESSTLEPGHPDYFGGNLDVQETAGYGDIGVQVTHQSTQQPTLTGACNPAGPSQCEQSTLADGSILRTERVHAGPHNLILTAEVSRPDGVLVQAQESNYPFGPDAANEAHGSEPLTRDQLITLAEDSHFSF